ncbi:hypothetical protein AOC36_02060 [Erysipelothrix larvae]|uniref:Uncharacterized protein n=1 Tax=Erysipelothrix larvae TaxID=1514105 RepID=A0A0X8GYK9_9FIRM|nr:hypothetical protein [Erysipelothrix larvae]AMC92810.1 hypothetical protein AOC36_02060 [Erysipelothrix larvae]
MNKQTVNQKSNEMKGCFYAEKEQTNTLVGIIFILAIAVGVGTIFLSSFPKIGDQVIETVERQFNRIESGND